MGNASSAEDDHAPQREHHEADNDAEAFADASTCGFRVLGIQERSPASRAGLVSFFDFVVAANGIRLDTKDATFMELLAQSEERAMQIDVFNSKAQTTRQLLLTPSRRWHGKGLLGVTIRFDSFEHADDELLHVLHVAPGSPAETAGLEADVDYLLGTPHRVFRDPEDLQEEILDAVDDAFQCYVYSIKSDQVRVVTISPHNRWGDDGGFLGAEVGHGVLHRLPSSCRSTIGSSTGFVSISEEAAAATDKYLRSEPPAPAEEAQDDESTATSETQHQSTPDDTTLPATAAAESTTEATSEPSTTTDAALPVEQRTDAASTTESVETPSEPVTTPAPAPAPVPAAVPPPVDAKPRYAARIDPRFPISTIEVLADPMQLR
ncbi:hypothetical protein PINS_up017332 [Pythium insidiosum]|nr:hypothetical protein PINS_up013837 [Pythium insidiosum]GLE07272.1 hypothetical protein PINS_up017332 [Pythium insidiosum]